ncbi:winged helix-turn-helix transcriptional regulator [Nonomuraea dietziae]
MLIVRQLLISPARYRDLIDGLPGIATNLLADRLRDLDATVRADPASILGLAAGALTLSGARALGLVEIDGDESVIRTVLAA